VAAVEGVVAADEGWLNQASDEQMLDCDENNSGCGGGDPQVRFGFLPECSERHQPPHQPQTSPHLLPNHHHHHHHHHTIYQLALEYVTQHPLVGRSDYPYTAAIGRAAPTCKVAGLEPVSGIQSYLYVQPCDDRVLMQAVARGPVVVALDAYCPEFMNYKSGVMTFSCAQPLDDEPGDAMCERAVNHAVALVGYGTDERTGLDFWLIKNSWGTVRVCVVACAWIETRWEIGKV
jgi:KDEL-tailed cysteine endopeptidase